MSLSDLLANVLDERQIRHIKNAVLLREETQTTYLDRGLAIPHGRSSVLESISVCVGLSQEGIPWPDSEHKAHMIILLGVPTVMVTGYLTTLQKLLRWHKGVSLNANGAWQDTEQALITALQQVLQ